MRLTIDKEPLRKAVALARNVTVRGDKIPILGCLLLEALEGDRLRITSTNVEAALQVELDAQVEAEGAIAVDAARLATFANGVADGAQVSLTAKGMRLGLKAGRSSLTLAGLPADDYPRQKLLDEGDGFTLEAATLRGGLERVAGAMCNEETRYYLCGVHAAVEGDALTLTATDGHRLHQTVVTISDRDGDLPTVIVPRVSVGVLSKLLGEGGNLRVEINQDRLRAVLGDGHVIYGTRLVDGTYPEFAHLFTGVVSRMTCRARVARLALSAAAGRLGALVEGDKSKFRIVAVTQDSGALRFQAQDNFAEAVEVVDITCDTPFPGWWVEARNLHHALDSLPGDEVELQFADPSSPIILQVPDNDAERRLLVLARGVSPQAAPAIETEEA